MVKEHIFVSLVKRPIFFSFSKEVSGNEVRFMDDLNMSDDSNNNNNNNSQFRFGRKESVKSNNNSSNNNNNTTSANSTSNAQTKPKM